METRPYNLGTIIVPKRQVSPKTSETFGQRLARLRKAAGYSQRGLAAELGISQRVVAYYEGETDHAPDHLLPRLAEVLGVSADELLGIKREKVVKSSNQRLWRRFKQIERLPAKERKHLLGVIDALLQSHQVARRDT